jgi:hypothetical protein
MLLIGAFSDKQHRFIVRLWPLAHRTVAIKLPADQADLPLTSGSPLWVTVWRLGAGLPIAGGAFLGYTVRWVTQRLVDVWPSTRDHWGSKPESECLARASSRS